MPIVRLEVIDEDDDEPVPLPSKILTISDAELLNFLSVIKGAPIPMELMQEYWLKLSQDPSALDEVLMGMAKRREIELDDGKILMKKS